VTRLHIDYESRSAVDLIEAGLHAYARDKTTRVLMAAWAIDDEPVELWLPHVSPKAPPRLRDAMRDPSVEKWAWNANFERAITEHTLGLKVDGWRDTMVMALYASLPGSLALAGAALRLPEADLKDPEGKRLIRLFSLPRRVTEANSSLFNDWNSHPEDFEKFGAYCIRDVHTERTIYHKLKGIAPPASEWKLWELDQEINTRGVPVDTQFVDAAIEMAANEKAALLRKLREITGLDNPKTQSAFLKWAQAEGYPYGDLRKATVERAIREGVVPEHIIETMKMRSLATKTSTAKFDSIKEKTRDGRIYNMLQFYGASRTGRWGGRDPQPQNLPRPDGDIEGQEERVTEMVCNGEIVSIINEFGNVTRVVSSLVRSSFRASPGHTFYAADLNAIENRVLGWMFNCQPILDVFREGRCPYLDFGTRMYKQPYEEMLHEYKVLKQKKKRQNSKPAVLGGGYMLGGGDEVENENGDIVKTGLWGYAEAMGIKMTREEAHEAVRVFRESYPEVVQGWANLRDAAFDCVRDRTTIRVGPVIFKGDNGMMRVKLPSGRVLHYLYPRIEEVTREFKRTRADGTVEIEKKKVPALSYEGVNQLTKKWGRTYTHGGKLTENLVQAIARDVLAAGLVRATKLGFKIVLHVHDEIVCEVPDGSKLTIDDLCEAMASPISWAPGLPLAAEGAVSHIYKK
jgi:DNA polymerase